MAHDGAGANRRLRAAKGRQMSDQTFQAAPAEADFVAILSANNFANIIDECQGCGHVRAHEEGHFCRSYAAPASKWALGMCNFATHRRIEKTESAHKVNPLKASKRGGA